MDGAIDGAAQKCVFNFLGKEPLAPCLNQRAILNPVAGGGDGDNLKGAVRPVGGQGVKAGKLCPHKVCLKQRQRAAARTDLERGLQFTPRPRLTPT